MLRWVPCGFCPPSGHGVWSDVADWLLYVTPRLVCRSSGLCCMYTNITHVCIIMRSLPAALTVLAAPPQHIAHRLLASVYPRIGVAGSGRAHWHSLMCLSRMADAGTRSPTCDPEASSLRDETAINGLSGNDMLLRVGCAHAGGRSLGSSKGVPGG